MDLRDLVAKTRHLKKRPVNYTTWKGVTAQLPWPRKLIQQLRHLLSLQIFEVGAWGCPTKQLIFYGICIVFLRFQGNLLTLGPHLP